MSYRVFSCEWPPINDGFLYSDKITNRDANKSVFNYYKFRYVSSGTPEQWMQRILNKQIQINEGSQNLEPGTVLKAGDQLTYYRTPWAEPEAPNCIAILYEDDHVLALAKPAGLQVLPKASFCQRTVLGLLQSYQQQHRCKQYPGSFTPTPVHRLGRGTSGVLLCACTPTARQKLAKDFSMSTELGVALSTVSSSSSSREAPTQRPLGKTYRALVCGLVQNDQGEVNVPIGLISYPGLGTGLFAASSSGKRSKSLYRVLHRHADSTLVEVTILTGRPHQIRIHMAALGHPLVGDPLYGVGGVPLGAGVAASKQGAYGDADSVMPGDCGYHLHSMDLKFTHPVSGQEMHINAPIPPRLQTPEEQASSTAAAKPSS